MAEQWYYLANQETKGPVEFEALKQLAASGVIARETLVWKEGLAAWTAASAVSGLFTAAGAHAAAPPPPPSAVARAQPARGILSNLGAKLSHASELPTVSGIPVGEILMGGLGKQTRAEDIEHVFAAGTAQTTPAISEVAATWPTPRVFWRVLAGAVGTYALLRLGYQQFQNPNFIPGMIVIGSFVVPFSVVVLLFELNTPRNVSVYQVGKLILFGGALSLILTSVLFQVLPGSGVGDLIPAMLTGVIEETGKALALLIMVRSMRYPYQLNGVLFGAAVGAGFAGFESAGYAFNSETVQDVFESIWMRGILAPGGHVIWTAMVGSAIWRVKGNKPFGLAMLFHRDVVRRWAIAVILHGIWDMDLVPKIIPWWVKLAILIVIGWYLVFAILKQSLGEVEEAQAAAASPAAGG
ncbi:MAG: PrsW family glutamic-type intramembrane protease [Acidobacteriota bacterium]